MIENRQQDALSVVEQPGAVPAQLSVEELARVAGGYPCSYLGVHDYNLMMSYETRNYSC